MVALDCSIPGGFAGCFTPTPKVSHTFLSHVSTLSPFSVPSCRHPHLVFFEVSGVACIGIEALIPTQCEPSNISLLLTRCL